MPCLTNSTRHLCQKQVTPLPISCFHSPISDFCSGFALSTWFYPPFLPTIPTLKENPVRVPPTTFTGVFLFYTPVALMCCHVLSILVSQELVYAMWHFGCFYESRDPSHTQHLLTTLDHCCHVEDAQKWGLRLLIHNC